VNLKNGKRYVGQYKDVLAVIRRWRKHLKCAFDENDPRPLYCALRKADRESEGRTVGFSAEVIWRGSVSKLDEKEIYYIKKLRSFIDDPKGDRSYNLTKGGLFGIRGFKFSEASKKKVSAASLARWADLEWRESMCELHRRRFDDPAAHEVVSNGLRELYKNPAERAKQSAAQLLSYAENPDRHLQLREAHQLYWLEPDAHEKASAALHRRFEDPAERKKLSVAQLRRYEDLEERRKTSVAMKLSYAENPDICARQSASQTLRYSKPEEREKQRVAQVARYENPLEHEKLSAAGKLRWASMTPDERTAYWRQVHPHGSVSGVGRLYAKMTPEERKAYWHKTHPNGTKKKA
jgi:hypothetical protein